MVPASSTDTTMNATFKPSAPNTPNTLLQGKGFHVSYNDRDTGPEMYGSVTTAIVTGDMDHFYILSGDFREALAPLVPLGLAACLDFLDRNADKLNPCSESLPPLAKVRTASDLKYRVEQSGNCPHFFTRQTMKFFGDTMRNYYVPRGTFMIKTHSGKEIRCFKLGRRSPVKHGLQSPTFFNCRTFERVLPAN